MAVQALLLAGAVLLQVQRALSAYHYLDASRAYRMDWEYTTTNITITLTANVTGWIGLGFSPNGGMEGADIVMAYVDSGGAVVLQDRYATSMTLPVLDEQQDYKLLSGQRTNGQLKVKFVRLLDTCDVKDAVIKPYTTKVIYAYGNLDGAGAPSYHNSNRGAANLYLLTPDTLEQNDSGIFYIDTTPRTISLPATSTTYWCSVVKLPSITNKSHVIGFEAAIPPANLDIVHHMLVYGCETVNESFTSFDCYFSSGGDGGNRGRCQNLIAIWASGGGEYRFPTDVGLPIGGEGGPKYVLIETHYNNMNAASGRTDASYLRLRATSNLRRYDAGVIQTGAIFGILVPPNTASMSVSGFCSQNCLSSQNLPANGITVFGVGLHSHLLGRGIALRQFRPSAQLELPLVANDPQYSFDYQQLRTLESYRQVLPGDVLQTVCTMSSTGRNVATVGGLSTMNEMCLSFLFYYPRTNVTLCTTTPLFVYIPSDYIYIRMNASISNFNWGLGFYTSLDNAVWTNSVTAEIESRYTGPGFETCLGNTVIYYLYNPPSLASLPLPRDSNPSNSSCNRVTTTASVPSASLTSATPASLSSATLASAKASAQGVMRWSRDWPLISVILLVGWVTTCVFP